jgi:hypothetical protein
MSERAEGTDLMPGRAGETGIRGRTKWIVLGVAWTAYAVSWLLPVLKLKGSELLRDLDHGWKAFMIVLSLAIKPESFDWFWALCINSVLSNLTVLISPWMLRRASVPRWFVGTLIFDSVMNLTWTSLTSDSTLLAGYWLWVGSMAVLSVVAVANRKRVAPLIIRKRTFTSA